jgi:hypothetical protein
MELKKTDAGEKNKKISDDDKYSHFVLPRFFLCAENPKRKSKALDKLSQSR